MKKTRLLLCVISMLMALCLLVSCNSNADDGTTAPDTTPAVTTERTRPTYTVVTTAKEPSPADMPNDGDILVSGVNITSYKIIYGASVMEDKAGSMTGKTIAEDLAPYLQGEEKASDFDYQCAVRLQQLIKTYYGVELELVKDEDIKNPSRYEILVGYTDRQGSARTKLALKDMPENYICGPNDLTANLSTQYIVCGGSYGATWHALDEIEKYFEENKTAEKLDLANLDVEGQCELTFIACIGDSITRGSQALPQLPHYGNGGNVTEDWGSNATTVYFEQYLSYPATMQRELWKTAIVYNFGRGASTARNYGDSNYYGTSTQFTKCLTTSNLEAVDFDIVFLMHGTNDAGKESGAAKWDDAKRADFQAEIKLQMDKILEGSPDAMFVMNNAPHRCDGDNANANDAAIRTLQKETATALKAAGYNVCHYDMEAFTTENLRSADSCGTDSAGEYKAHEGYYNIYYGGIASFNDKTHPNYAGYGKMAEGLIDVVDYLVNGAAAPEYMIDIG